MRSKTLQKFTALLLAAVLMIPSANSFALAKEPQAETQKVVYAASDTYVVDNKSTSNYDASETLQLKRAGSGNRLAYLAFDLSDVDPTFLNCELQLDYKAANAPGENTMQVGVFSLIDEWSSNTVTWANQPASEGVSPSDVNFMGTFTNKTDSYLAPVLLEGEAVIPMKNKQTTTADLTSYLRQELDEGETEISLRLAILSQDSTASYINIISKEGGTEGTQPRLVFTYPEKSDTDASASEITFLAGQTALDTEPAFSPMVYEYSAQVGYTTEELTFSAEANQDNAKAAVYLNDGAEPISGKSVPLTVGENTVTVHVTAPDGKTIQKYIFTITRQDSGNADLACLELDGFALNPTFDPDTLRYTGVAEESLTATALTVETADENSTCQVYLNHDEKPVDDLENISLTPGRYDTLTIVCASQNGTIEKTYEVLLQKAGDKKNEARAASISLADATSGGSELAPVFDPDVFEYRADLPNSVDSLTIKVETVDPAATVSVSSENASVEGLTVSGLSTGANIVTVKITAADGIATREYTLVLKRMEAPRTFYLSSFGSDDTDGTSPETAWKSLNKLDNVVLRPGDQVLLERGSVFTGTLTISGQGLINAPIVVQPYGDVDKPMPVINGTGENPEGATGNYDSLTLEKADSYTVQNAALHILDSAYVTVRDLELTNTTAGKSVTETERGQGNYLLGVLVENRGAGTLRGIDLDGLYIHDVTGYINSNNLSKATGGIGFVVSKATGEEDPSRFADCTIENCTIKRVNSTGIFFDFATSTDKTGPSGSYTAYIPSRKGSEEALRKRTAGGQSLCWDEIKWSNMAVRDNLINDTGKNAMIIRMTDETSVVEQNTVHNVSYRETAGNSVMSRSVYGTVFQYNEAYKNLESKDQDGCGFDADYYSPATVWQYNYSHDNNYGLITFCTKQTDEDIIVRYNIERNGRGRVLNINYNFSNLHIYNNLFYFDADITPTHPNEHPSGNRGTENIPVIWETYRRDDNSDFTGTMEYKFYNNIVYSAGNPYVTHSFSPDGSRGNGSMQDRITRDIDNNIFFGSDGVIPDQNLAGIGTHNINADPRMKDAAGARGSTRGDTPGQFDLDEYRSLFEGYCLTSSSPAIGAGRPIGLLREGETVLYDLMGNPVNLSAPDIGPIQFQKNESSSGGSSSGSGSSTTTEITKNPDGSTTKTITDKKAGTVTETTTWPNGDKVVVKTEKDGTVTETVTHKDGYKNEAVTKPDGSVTMDIKETNGVHIEVETDVNGKTTAEIDLPENMQESRVEIPLKDADLTTVVVIIGENGTEEIVKNCILTENGVSFTAKSDMRVKLVDNGKDFVDVPAGYWGADAIDFVTSRELFKGTGASTFAPNGTTSRAMFFTVLAHMAGVDTEGGVTWYDKAMKWSAENGISDGSNPNSLITREQLATMLYRYAGKPEAEGTGKTFADSDKISAWAVDAMDWAVKSGVLSGKGGDLLDPTGTATRAEAAQIIMNFYENVK